MRLFAALPIPDRVAQSLLLLEGGIPGARWQTREQLHLTLRFIGEVDGRQAADIDEALAAIRAPGLCAGALRHRHVRPSRSASSFGPVPGRMRR